MVFVDHPCMWMGGVIIHNSPQKDDVLLNLDDIIDIVQRSYPVLKTAVRY